MKRLYGKFSDKSLLFIGPGCSKKQIDLKKAKSQYDCIATLNDTVLEHQSDLYFVGEKYIFDFVAKNADNFFRKQTYIICPGLAKSHKTRIDKDYFLKKMKSFKYMYFVPPAEKKPNLKYTLKTIRKFNKGNMEVLANLLHHFPINQAKYIRTRTLSNALQVIFNLGFTEVALIGFMDSKTYQRSNNDTRKAYLKIAKKISPGMQTAEDRTDEQLIQSFEYQCQILITLDHVFNQHNRLLVNLCPKQLSPQHYLRYKEC